VRGNRVEAARLALSPQAARITLKIKKPEAPALRREVGTRNPFEGRTDVVPIHTEFMQSQLGFMGEQIKSLGEIYTKAATEVLNAPLTTDAIRELTSSIIPPSVRLPRHT